MVCYASLTNFMGVPEGKRERGLGEGELGWYHHGCICYGIDGVV
jgi:hypothetical protein